MNERFLASLVAVLLTPGFAAGQTSRTPDGQPDLQGIWTNATITPFERPTEFAGKEFLTEKEAADLEARAAGNAVDRPPAAGDTGTYNQFRFDRGTKVVKTRRTSLVVDPPDGRVPLRPEAEAKRDYDLEHSADSDGRKVFIGDLPRRAAALVISLERRPQARAVCICL